VLRRLRQNPSSPPFTRRASAGAAGKREAFPLFEKEGLGEIFMKIYLLNYGALGNIRIFKGE
jgi:hypothetical protein